MNEYIAGFLTLAFFAVLFACYKSVRYVWYNGIGETLRFVGSYILAFTLAMVFTAILFFIMYGVGIVVMFLISL